MQEPAILNATLALAASHHSRWQHTADNVSRKYLRAASKALRDRFSTRNLVHSQVTLAAMLLLVSFEVYLFLLIFYPHPTMLFTMPVPMPHPILGAKSFTLCRYSRARVGGRDIMTQFVAGSNPEVTALT